MSEDSRTDRFQRIALPHLDAAYSLARWLLRSPTDAEDVVQEAMLRAYRAFDGCREATARAWLLRIVRNAAYDCLDSGDRRHQVGLADLVPEDADGPDLIANVTADAFGEPAQDPESILLKEDTRRLVNDLIAALPVAFREVVVLRDLDQLSYKEIAEVAGIPVGTVMSRLARGRDLLQRAWRERNG